MQQEARSNEVLGRFHDRELDLLKRAIEAGVTLAIPAALHYCAENSIDPPQWVVTATLSLLCDLLKRETSTKRGRSGGSIARYHQDMIDFMRWNQIICLREKQSLAQESMAWLSEKTHDATCPRHLEEIARAEWLGKTLDRAFECAAEGLERTEAFGSPSSMERSYKEVERNNRDPLKALRYIQLDALFLRMLGIEDDLGYGTKAKWFPWRQYLKPRQGDTAAQKSRALLPNVSRETNRDHR